MDKKAQVQTGIIYNNIIYHGIFHGHLFRNDEFNRMVIMSATSDYIRDLLEVTTLADIANQTRVSKQTLTKYLKKKNIKPSHKNSKPIFQMWVREVCCHG